MPRYFFHVHDGGDFLDEVGVVLAGPIEARRQATTSAGEILRERVPATWHDDDWMMEVKNEAGGVVCQLHFSAVNKTPDEDSFDVKLASIIEQHRIVSLLAFDDPMLPEQIRILHNLKSDFRRILR